MSLRTAPPTCTQLEEEWLCRVGVPHLSRNHAGLVLELRLELVVLLIAHDGLLLGKGLCGVAEGAGGLVCADVAGS